MMDSGEGNFRRRESRRARGLADRLPNGRSLNRPRPPAGGHQ
jgi:hypothetical protein